MKRLLGILAAGALAACGSSNNPPSPPNPTIYTFDAGVPVSEATSDQQTAATDAQSSTTQLSTAATSGNVSQVSNTPNLPGTVAGDLGDGEGALGLKNPAFAIAGKRSKTFGKTRGSNIFVDYDSSCYTVNGNTITYDSSLSGCDLVTEGQGFTESFNGTLTLSTSGAVTTLTWNINENFADSDSQDNLTFNFQGSASGSMTFTSSDTDIIISGTATEGFGGSFSDGSDNEQFGFTEQAVFKSVDVNIGPNGGCDDDGPGITSGAVDVSVTEVVTGGDTTYDGIYNFGVEFSWQGCNNEYFSIGTPQN